MTAKSKTTYLICSDCFFDEGLKLDSIRIGIKNDGECPHCKSRNGYKLTKNLVRTLCYRFFVRGTITKCNYGGFPLIQFNEQHFSNSEINVSPWLENDVNLIESIGKIGLFYYGPRFWMFGEIEPLKSLQRKKMRLSVIDRILNEYPQRIISNEDFFYRLRINPKVPYEISEYDSPPDKYLGKGRLDDKDFPVLYASQDLELCVHECRATVNDDIFISKLKPTKRLKLINLTELIYELNVTEFESLDIAIHFLFLAGKHSYKICREIAKAALSRGFDGIIYPSYFSYIRTGMVPFDTVYGISIRRINQLKRFAKSQIIPNIALFGRPIKEDFIKVDCINRVLINLVDYKLSFGPAYNKAYENE
jgi:hypothetical protein